MHHNPTTPSVTEPITEPTFFTLLVQHYAEMKRVLASLEGLIFSYPVEEEEIKIQEGIAQETWNRDFVVNRCRNGKAWAVLQQSGAGQRKNVAENAEDVT